MSRFLATACRFIRQPGNYELNWIFIDPLTDTSDDCSYTSAIRHPYTFWLNACYNLYYQIALHNIKQSDIYSAQSYGTGRLNGK